MKGLKTQESSDFVEFMKRVQEEAQKTNKTFFLDCEDGKDGVVDGLPVCDLFGWLISKDQESSFLPIWEKDEINDDWFPEYVAVTWKQENGLKLIFS